MLVKHSDPTLPVLMNYCQAHTQRWTGGDKVNLQNLPSARKGQSTRLRRAIQAPPGYLLAVADYAQVECRMGAWIAEEEALLSIFREGQDPYIGLASTIVGFPVTKKEHPNERALGKAGELSLIFGVGWNTFAETVRTGLSGPPYPITDQQAQLAVKVYRQTRPKVVRSWSDMSGMMSFMQRARGPDAKLYRDVYEFRRNRVLMPNGLYMHYNELYTVEDGGMPRSYFKTKGGNYDPLYPAKLFQHLVQSSARTLMAQRAVELAKEFRIVLLVHDEIVFLIPENDADDALKHGLDILGQPPSWCSDLPLEVEGAYAPNYIK
jgi:DNA polymerase I-like protein with 3'-5' exonuclease and polymerase domains